MDYQFLWMLLPGTLLAQHTDLLSSAKARQPIQFEQVLRVRFDPAGSRQFDELRAWAERPTPDELSRFYMRLPGEKAFYRELTPCWEADFKGLVRAMVVAAAAPTPEVARQTWLKAEKAYQDGLVLENNARKEAIVEGGARPTEYGKELALRAAMDQAWRAVQHGQAYSEEESEAILWRLWSKTCHVGTDNVAFLKSKIESVGWPTISRDGIDAAHDAFLIVQHADDDPKFQSEVLRLIQPLVTVGEASGATFAALFDRVALAGGKRQRYGTQFGMGKNGCSAVRPTESPEGIDERRASVGLPPLKEYAKTLAAKYKIEICFDVFDTSERL